MMSKSTPCEAWQKAAGIQKLTANANWNVKGLVLEGVPGTGKTTLLRSILRSQRYVDRSFLSTIVLSEHQTQRVLEAKEKEEGLDRHDNVTLLESHVRYLGGILRGLKGMPWCENGRTNNRVTYLIERFHLTHVYHYAHVEWKDVAHIDSQLADFGCKLCLVIGDPREIVERIRRDRPGWKEWAGGIDAAGHLRAQQDCLLGLRAESVLESMIIDSSTTGLENSLDRVLDFWGAV